jgi:hypothetical protein
MSHSNLRIKASQVPTISAYPSIPVIELSATPSITPSYSASMSLSYSQYTTSSPTPTSMASPTCMASPMPTCMAMASPMPMPVYQWSTSVSIPMIDAQLLGMFSAIFTVVLCSLVHNIRHNKKEKTRSSPRFRYLGSEYVSPLRIERY